MSPEGLASALDVCEHRAATGPDVLKWRALLANRRMEFTRAHPSSQRGTMPVLQVRNFAQIKDARIEFGDLTILVGPQATGKSLVLQWFKAAKQCLWSGTAKSRSISHGTRTPM
jgi:hypothetical protein